uniref:Vesicle-fusing ATPase n=1 Tax=Syphacia muris TaxID=451379 RepID=A0A0N5AC77_9BILA
MAREFSIQFAGHAFTKGQLLVFRYEDEKQKTHLFSLVVSSLEGIVVSVGQLLPNSVIIFERAEGSIINLIGKSKGKSSHQSIINSDWNFEDMGIGGLDEEFSGIFRRAFASRLFPPEVIEQLRVKHVRGILLYGPPGTGKTLMARQIGNMLSAREPKIVNGPEILDKYVGESESNIRKLFADAEEEWKRAGLNSALHIIIFDEIDAICKKRGSVVGSTSVHDTVVNQILSKMDGVGQLNNILVIAMTNRLDMIDEALLRPGRFEVQLEISLPNEEGRLQILKIHTSTLREYGKLKSDVDLADLAKRTKNFSGAEIEGLVRAALSTAMNRLIKVGKKVEADPDAFEKLMVTAEDFDYALENDVKPAFGRSDEKLEEFMSSGFVAWSPDVLEILDEGERLVRRARESNAEGLFTALIAGAPNTGKSCLAAMIAQKSEFPFVKVYISAFFVLLVYCIGFFLATFLYKVCSPASMIGFSETAKCLEINKCFNDAYKSPLSLVIIDDIEGLLDFSPIGPRYSNIVRQALAVLLTQKPPKNHKLVVLVTSSERAFLREVRLMPAFKTSFDVPALRTVEDLMTVINDSSTFSPEERKQIQISLSNSHPNYFIGIKQLLSLINICSGESNGSAEVSGSVSRADALIRHIEASVTD